jgi:hypothetical protein
VNIPVEIFEKDLTPAEFRVIVSLYHVADGRGVANILQDELSELTKYSPEHLRRTIRSLESRELVVTTRKKRNFGKYHRNVYQLVVVPEYVSPSHTQVGSTKSLPEKSPSHTQVGSTYNCITNKLTSTNPVINTSYLLHVRTSAHEGKEIKVGKWNWDEDENLGGVGLFEEEIAQKNSPKKPSKSDARTRNQRPDYEWTPFDTAAEFGELLHQKFPDMPRLINTRNLGMILSKYRRELNTTALVELELIKIFFADERNLAYVARNPKKAMGVFLNLFKSRLSDVFERLVCRPLSVIMSPKLTGTPSFLYATDGIKFENNLVGRKALQLHEERLARNV